MERPRKNVRRPLPGSPFKRPTPPPVKTFAVQDRVTHDAHGLGTVLEVEEGIAVLIDFGTQKLRIVAPYDRLFKL